MEPHQFAVESVLAKDHRARQIRRLEELNREGAAQYRQEFVVRAAGRVLDLRRGLQVGGDTLGRTDAVVRIHLGTAAPHDLRGPGIRADDRDRAEPALIERQDALVLE